MHAMSTAARRGAGHRGPRPRTRGRGGALAAAAAAASAGVGAAPVDAAPGGLAAATGATASLVQETKLVGAGVVGQGELGHSVALSADGDTAVVGGWRDDQGDGAAWVFTRSGGQWSQQG